MELKKIQKDIWQNKVNKGFNTTDVNKEFCLLYGEVAEAYDAWRKKKDDLNEELADIAIYLMGLSEMLGFDLEEEIEKKVSKNEKRVYKNIDGGFSCSGIVWYYQLCILQVQSLRLRKSNVQCIYNRSRV